MLSGDSIGNDAVIDSLKQMPPNHYVIMSGQFDKAQRYYSSYDNSNIRKGDRAQNMKAMYSNLTLTYKPDISHPT